MASRRRRGTVRGSRRLSKLNRAKVIIATVVGRGAKRAIAVQRAVVGRGISLRTYRTARKQMRTGAIRRSFRGLRRGRGVWYVSRRK